MGLKLIHISKRGNWWSNPLDITLVVLTINCLCRTFPDFAIKVLCFLTTINLTFKVQLMVHEKLSWRNCKCPVDLWQPGQIVLMKFHLSKNPAPHSPAIVMDWNNLYQDSVDACMVWRRSRADWTCTTALHNHQSAQKYLRIYCQLSLPEIHRNQVLGGLERAGIQWTVTKSYQARVDRHIMSWLQWSEHVSN